MANEEYHITCIIGDLLERYITISDPSAEVIDSIRFTCVGEGIYSYLPWSEYQNAWCLRFGKEVTSCFRPGTFMYDLTAVLVDGNEQTLIYQGLLTAKAKLRPDESVGEEDETEEEDSPEEEVKEETEEESEEDDDIG